MTPGRRITCQSVHSGILFQAERVFVDSGIMWKFSMTLMGFNRWTDTNETFPYQKSRRLIVVMLFLFCLLFILCMCVFFAVLVSFIFSFIYSFIYLFTAGEPYASPQTLLYNSEKKPKLVGCKIRRCAVLSIGFLIIQGIHSCALTTQVKRTWTRSKDFE